MSAPEVFLDRTDNSVIVSWGDQVHRMDPRGKVSHRWSAIELHRRTETHHSVEYLTREQLLAEDEAVQKVLRAIAGINPKILTKRARDAISDALDVDWPKPEEKSA